MPPLDTDPHVVTLKGALDAKTAEAKQLYADFENERKKVVESGVDLTKDTEAMKRLDDLHQAYKVVADDAQDLRDRLDRELLGMPSKSAGESGDTPGAVFVKGLAQQGIDFKAVTTGGSIVPATFDSLIRTLPQRQLRLRNLVRVDRADADLVSFLQQTVFTNAAAPVAAGALKPTSTMTVQRVDQAVVTLAHMSEPVDRSLLMDADQLAEFIDQQLILGVLLAEENQIVNGSGAGGNLRGILNTSGVLSQARATDPAIDAIIKAMTAIRSQFFEPSAVLLHPTDWQNLRLAKNANGDYYFGSPGITAEPAIDGVPIAISPVLAAGTALVGDFEQATLWLREDARVTFAESGGLGAAGAEIYSRNQIVFRGEERVAFGVVRPPAFCQVTGL
jgi:HK97 family phage major capsid protein